MCTENSHCCEINTKEYVYKENVFIYFKVLLKHGAVIDQRSEDTPLIWAIKGNHNRVVQCLIDSGKAQTYIRSVMKRNCFAVVHFRTERSCVLNRSVVSVGLNCTICIHRGSGSDQ